jgi:hypothetical protein
MDTEFMPINSVVAICCYWLSSIVLCPSIRLADAIHSDLKPIEFSLESSTPDLNAMLHGCVWLLPMQNQRARAVRSGFFHHINALALVGRRSFKHRPAVLIFSEKQKQNGF